jgi:hypothetical protein
MMGIAFALEARADAVAPSVLRDATDTAPQAGKAAIRLIQVSNIAVTGQVKEM